MLINIVPTHETTVLTSQEPLTRPSVSVPSPAVTSVAYPVALALSFTEHREQTAASARLQLINQYSHMSPINHEAYVHHVPSEPND